MLSDQITRLVVDAMVRLGMDYMVVGSFSSNVWGIVRSTQDADFVIATDADISPLNRLLDAAFQHEPQMSFETVLMTTKYLYAHRETGFKVEIFVLSNDPHDRARFDRRTTIVQDGQVVYVPTPEDVIIQKLRWGRRKDLADVRDVIDVQGEALDFAYIRSWTDTHGSTQRLDAILNDPDDT